MGLEDLSIPQQATVEACFDVGDDMMHDVEFAIIKANIAFSEAVDGAIGTNGQAYTTIAQCIITLGWDCAGNFTSLIDDLIETISTVVDGLKSLAEAESNLESARSQYEECKALCDVFAEQIAVDESQKDRIDTLEGELDSMKGEMETLQSQLEAALEALREVE